MNILKKGMKFHIPVGWISQWQIAISHFLKLVRLIVRDVYNFVDFSSFVPCLVSRLSVGGHKLIMRPVCSWNYCTSNSIWRKLQNNVITLNWHRDEHGVTPCCIIDPGFPIWSRAVEYFMFSQHPCGIPLGFLISSLPAGGLVQEGGLKRL